jgi:cell wall assembly regulator SMI1
MAKIVAVVTVNPEHVSGGGAPIFIARDQEEREKVAFSLEKMMDASAHDLVNGAIVLIDHKTEAATE